MFPTTQKKTTNAHIRLTVDRRHLLSCIVSYIKFIALSFYQKIFTIVKGKL